MQTIKKNTFIIAVLGLCCCTGYSLVAVHWLLRVVVSLFAENGLWGTQASVVAAHELSSDFQAPEHGLSSCGAQA